MRTLIVVTLLWCWMSAAPQRFLREEPRGKLTSEVKLSFGKPALFVNGSLASSLMFFSRSADEAWPFIKAGIKVGDFDVPFGWIGPEQYDFATTDAAMDAFLKLDAQLLALPRFNVTPGDWWCKIYPNEITMRSDGTPAVSHHPGATIPMPPFVRIGTLPRTGTPGFACLPDPYGEQIRGSRRGLFSG